MTFLSCLTTDYLLFVANREVKELPMIEIKVQKNIPMPERRQWGKSKYKFSQMDVGDSIFVTGQHGGTKCNAAVASQVWASTQRKKGNHVKFIARKEGEGVRIWRSE